MPKPRKHKRRGPKSTRAGCLLCKPHKDQAVKGTRAAKTRQELQADDAERETPDRVAKRKISVSQDLIEPRLAEYLDQLDAEEGPVDETLIEKYARLLT